MTTSSRRTFLTVAAGGALATIVPRHVLGGAGFVPPSERINLAGIGAGGMGGGDIATLARLGVNVVALCDVDDERAAGSYTAFPRARRYKDFRVMLDKEAKHIDAVSVGTPDHIHAVASMAAIRAGKHVYCQKPLTRTLHECREVTKAAHAAGVATQMGNQGHATEGARLTNEWLQAGVIGSVREVHVWSDRAGHLWKQGIPRPTGTPPVPATLNWDLWLGPIRERPYHPAYAPVRWRGWWDFGTGALGDMACHTANLPFMALKLGSPTTVKAESGEINPETYPTWARITFQFPSRGEMPPVKFVWYEGFKDSRRILPPEDLLAKVLRPREKLSDSGCLLVGDKGILFSPNDYGGQYRLLPEQQFEGYKAPQPTLPRNGRDDLGMKEEWVRAIMENKPSIALSNFDYAALLTETILLGNVAMRVGKQINWDGEQLKVTNVPEAAQFIKPEYRKGWEI